MALPVLATIKVRGDTAANWTSVNPVLAAKEIGLETDTRKTKYGDGATAWASLAYSAAGAIAWADITSQPTTLAGYGITDAQPIDADLTAIAALGPSDDDIIQCKAGDWVNRTLAQLRADLATATPAFSVSLASAVSNVTGDGTVYTVLFDTELGDQGANYDPSTGQFTAPVAGYYHFDARVLLSNAASVAYTTANLRLISGGISYYLVHRGNTAAFETGSNGFISLAGAMTLPMTAGQTAEIAVAVSGATQIIGVFAAPHTAFSGHMVS